jgi:NAD(P)-dependent dehydrogenase (short-subunit alcohol dehydrogenase family)
MEQADLTERSGQMKLADKVAIVTGAARGIGREIALTLVREGGKVAICDVDVEPLNDVADEIKAAGGQAWAGKVDVTKSAEINQMVESTLQRFGRIDILVNNAGGSARDKASEFHEAEEEVWASTITRNLNGTLACTRAVINHMIERKSGKIVNLASVNGISGQAGFVDYSAAKAGIIGFTKALAKEVNAHGINVNAVAPGVIETRVVEQIPKETMEEILKTLKLNRLGQPEDVANAVLYLASDEASYITGHILVICGGGFIS